MQDVTIRARGLNGCGQLGPFGFGTVGRHLCCALISRIQPR